MNNYKFFLDGVYDGDLEKIKKYINKDNINSPIYFSEDYYEYPIYGAFQTGDPKIIKYFFDLGANPNIPIGNTNLLRLEISESLEFWKVNNEKEPDIEKIRLLIEYGADINKISKDGKSPLDCSISWGHKPAEDYLRSLGARKSTLYLLYLLHAGGKIHLEEIDKSDYLEMNPTIDELKDCDGNLFHYDVLYIWYLKDDKESELENILSFRTNESIKERLIPERNFIDKKGRTSVDLALEIGFISAEPILRKYGEKSAKELKH